MAERLQQEREAFEAWARSEEWTGWMLQRDARGFYLNTQLRDMWLGWAAHAAHRVRQGPGLVDSSPETQGLSVDKAADLQGGTSGAKRYRWSNSDGVLGPAADNVLCSRIAEAARAARPGGDSIDHGLSLMAELRLQGFGLIYMGEPAHISAPAVSTPVVPGKAGR